MGKCCSPARYVEPQYVTEVQVWKYIPETESHERELPDLLAQVQPQQQNANEGERATAWLRYGKDHDRLRDIWDYGGEPPIKYDAVSFLLPSGRRVYYLVREVQGFAVGFPNAHMHATLAKLTPAEADVVTGGGGGGGGVIDPELSTLVAEPETGYANGTSPVKLTLTLKYDDDTPAVGETVVFDGPAGAILDNEFTVTDEDGIATTYVGSEDVDEVTYSAFAGDEAVVIGPSNTVDWQVPVAHQTAINPASPLNGTCVHCDQLGGGGPMFETGVPNNYLSESFHWDCREQAVRWSLVYDPVTGDLVGQLLAGDEVIVTATANDSTWNPGVSIDLTITTYTDDCDWSNSSTIPLVAIT